MTLAAASTLGGIGGYDRVARAVYACVGSAVLLSAVRRALRVSGENFSRLRRQRWKLRLLSQPASFQYQVRNWGQIQHWVSKGWFLRIDTLLYGTIEQPKPH
mgnify:CR=1 FL=1